MKRLPILLAVLVALGAAAYVGSGYWRTPPEVAALGPETATIVPGVHILCGLGPSAAYVVETSDGLVLVDTGLEADTRPIGAEMAKLGLDRKPVLAILLTHAHGDHCGGADALRAATGARVYAGRGDVGVLEAGTPREAFFSTFYMPNHSPHPTHVDVPLSGGEVLAFGDTRFRAIAAPGHTPGSVCYLMERAGLRVLFGGDVITMLRGDGGDDPGGSRPLGTYAAYLSPRYRGDAAAYLDTLKTLRAMPVPDLVLPGHPLSDPTPQSPRLTQRRWEEMLDQGVRDMTTLLSRYGSDGAAFLDGRPKRLLPDLYDFGNFQGTAVYGLVASSKLYLVDAPGGPGLLDFVNHRARELGLKPTDPTAVLLTSCNSKDTAGLRDLVEKTRARVVVAPTGVSFVRSLCPPETDVLSADDLPAQGWFPVTPIPLGGRGRAPIAYQIPWGGKSVLFSGRIPVLFDHDSTEALASDLATRDDAVDYLIAVNRLAALKPDLWLPAVPADDQNAFLYDSRWKYIISNNYRLGRSILDRPR